MEKRDFIKKQIDQLAKILANIFAKLIGYKDSVEINDGIQETIVSLKEVGLDLNVLIDFTEDDLIRFLQSKNLSIETLEKLSDIMSLMATLPSEKFTTDVKKKFFKNSLFIYSFLQKSEADFSYGRYLKINRVQKLLDLS